MDTLALDCTYAPLERITWQRAISLFFCGKVEIVEEYEDREIKSVTFSIKMPSVVRFIRARRTKKKVVKFSRENVYLRDKGRCQYCDIKIPRASLTFDHVIPRSRGGKTEWTNIVIACQKCNQDKKNRTPAEAKMRLLSTPMRPKRLPDAMNFTLTWRRGDPETWKSWLTSIVYWTTELEP